MEALLKQLKHTPEVVSFEQVMAIINEHYHYQATDFSNGLGRETLHNLAGINEGSCRIFAFANLHQLSEAETLACFGDYYRKDVLPHPDRNDHKNIRLFMKYGWQGIRFNTLPLTEKKYA
ncbi:type III effector [Photobacterium aquae]|uniref:Type III effector n=1 Tax=Photobacterium aquae TaxID=1195763 RepID=A0A0J1H5D1_9GAMM|nr:HopJ type III effector protein [Photobacterium aquae]KLV06935.1 type III effector [Photobacterium aquae]